MFHLEKELHNRFAGKRYRGEWFVLEKEDVSYLKSLVPDGFVYSENKRVRSEKEKQIDYFLKHRPKKVENGENLPF